MDFATIGGFFAGVALLVYVMKVSSGDLGLGMYWDFMSIMIVVGGATAATVMRWPIANLVNTFKVVMKTIFVSTKDPGKLIDEIIELAQIARKESILALEKVEVEDKYLAKAVNFMVDGYDPSLIKEILDVDLKAMKKRHADGRGVMENMAEATPAFGMIGTVVGLIVIMANIADASKIGPGLAVALVTTLYGSLVANIVFIPLASKLKFRSNEELLNIEIVREGALSILSGINPNTIKQKLESYVSDKQEAAEKAA